MYQRTHSTYLDMSLSAIKRATMASFSPKYNTRYHVRSISLPARSHPSTIRIEEELTKLKTLEPSSSPKAEIISTCLSGLGQVFRFIEELLNLPLTQQALAQHQNEKLVNELLERSIRYIDICSNIRDTVLVMKEGARELQSALRRRKVGDFSNESRLSSVAAYISLRKKVKKEVSKSLATLKNIDNNFGDSPMVDVDDHRLFAMVRVLTEASLITISIFQLLLVFLSVPVLKPKQTGWSLVSKLVQKGVVACEDRRSRLNELESVDIAVSSLLLHGSRRDAVSERIQTAHRMLEALDVSIEGFENGLEYIKFDESSCEMEESAGGINVPANRPAPQGPSINVKQDLVPHIHPKFPDYDALAARFKALKYHKSQT
ncbi:hypothetical protein F0562_006811 [Nyssa sinensis]|uniref:DUF241 domain-containing protein n=1 Tax=Nyssa sinensis TaxID=561372 RepID=A0A5J5ARP6_9ASTE|nr:hypothetical protein F0562_006811 [Nyssa sinensis]